MATTITTDYTARAVVDGTTPRGIFEVAQEWYEEAQGDCDKADSMEDSAYYQGLVDAYTSLLEHFTVNPNPEETTA